MKANEEIENIYGPQSPGDNKFTRKARLLQSYYRVNVLKEKEYGIGPNENSVHEFKDESGNKTSKTEPSYYGNMLVGGEESNKNFFFKETFEYAKGRIKDKKKAETIGVYRLFNNMLSSMPMAFNLFHPLMMIKEEFPDALNIMIREAFPSLPIHNVEEIKIEFIPEPVSLYTNDKSAMDAVIFFKDEKGNDYFIAIEVKYTDSLGTNKASDNELKLKTAKELNQFTEEGIHSIEKGCQQIYRNYLLTEKYGKAKSYSNSYSIILAPKDHPSTEKEIASLKNNLKAEFHYKIEKCELESFVDKLKTHCPPKYQPWIKRFYDRYLDFSKVEPLIKNS